MPKLYPGVRIGAFDPGVTTGYAEGIYTGDGTFDLLISTEIKWDDRFQAVVGIVPNLDIIIYERFALYASHAKEMINNDFPSVQFIGALQLAAHLSQKLDRLVVQPAHERKNVAVLEHHMKKVRGSQHRIDAYQHLRYYCLFHRKDKH